VLLKRLLFVSKLLYSRQSNVRVIFTLGFTVARKLLARRKYRNIVKRPPYNNQQSAGGGVGVRHLDKMTYVINRVEEMCTSKFRKLPLIFYDSAVSAGRRQFNIRNYAPCCSVRKPGKRILIVEHIVESGPI